MVKIRKEDGLSCDIGCKSCSYVGRGKIGSVEDCNKYKSEVSALRVALVSDYNDNMVMLAPESHRQRSIRFKELTGQDFTMREQDWS